MFQKFLKRKSGQKGFTLMELMVVIVIVAILAAVAVPLYVNYVKDARRTEGKGAIGAVITAQSAYYQKSAGEGAATYGSIADLGGLLDVSEVEANGWSITIPANSATTYTVTATYGSDASVTVSYAYDRAGTPPGVWTPN